MVMETATTRWEVRVRRELTGNILPFWMNKVTDPDGGFYGLVDFDGVVDRAAPRSAVVNTRILWTFAAASRLIGDEYRRYADWAYDYIVHQFLDAENGGLMWMLDGDGKVLSDRKHIYAQAFGIYAFSEYARATGNPESLDRAVELFRLVEQYGFDPVQRGYFEARGRDWRKLEDMRLSEKDLNSPKSMNTHLHILESYTNLMRIWRAPGLVEQQTDLIAVMLDRIVDGVSGHFRLFFDENWNALNDHISYGHDIEGSWLLVEAAEVLGDAKLLDRARETAVGMAEAVYRQGRDGDGSLFYEADGNGVLIDANKHWWAQAEAAVGFFNAYQLTNDVKFRTASRAAWEYIETRMIDRIHGEWYAKLTPDGRPLRVEEDGDACLAGPWKCPYHNSRACFELMARLAR
jgi:cellobiose epimerase